MALVILFSSTWIHRIYTFFQIQSKCEHITFDLLMFYCNCMYWKNHCLLAILNHVFWDWQCCFLGIYLIWRTVSMLTTSLHLYIFLYLMVYYYLVFYGIWNCLKNVSEIWKDIFYDFMCLLKLLCQYCFEVNFYKKIIENMQYFLHRLQLTVLLTSHYGYWFQCFRVNKAFQCDRPHYQPQTFNF